MSSNFLNDENKGDIIIYQSESGETKIDVRFQDETVWLTQAQMEELFQSSHANVVEHIKNIYSEGELDESSTCRKFRQVRREDDHRDMLRGKALRQEPGDDPAGGGGVCAGLDHRSVSGGQGIDQGVQGEEQGVVPRAHDEDGAVGGGLDIAPGGELGQGEEAPVIWRGPVIAGVVKQFWNETVWGDVDYLFVDMPPGTGDVPLTVFQSLPVDGIVIVTSPQELVQMIVKKAYNMAEMMHVPVLGLVENFSYLKCPDCGKEIKLFGESHIDDVAKELGIPVFGKLPLDPAFAEQADKGAFATMENAYLDEGVEKLKTL